MIMPALWELKEVVYKECLAWSEHSVTGSQDESGLKLETDFRDTFEMLSAGAELMMCVGDTRAHFSETDPSHLSYCHPTAPPRI